jgi:hypothetical protein
MAPLQFAHRVPIPSARGLALSFAAVWLLVPTRAAHASFLHGEALDTLADVMSWVVMIVAPAVAIAVFLLIHILPEKIAEKKRHPQVKAIQCLCLLSLFFGGLLWPLAWLWAYTKPVLHKMAYGTDVGDDPHGAPNALEAKAAEAEQLRAKVAQLEKKLAGVAASLGRDA